MASVRNQLLATRAARESTSPFVDYLPWPAILIDESGNVSHLNQQMAARGLSLNDAKNRHLRMLFPQYYAALQGERPWLVSQEAEVALQSGNERCYEHIWLCRLLSGACMIIMDRTRMHELETGAAQTARLASLGFMLASVCHEVNNPMAAISSVMQILESKGGVSEGLRQKAFSIIAVNVRRMLIITRKLGVFSRVGESVRADFCVDAAIAEAIVQLSYDSFGETVQLHHRPDPRAIVSGYQDQLQQVFFNIFLNAAQAMTGRGSITVVTQCVAPAEVVISISDTGPGIAPQYLAKVFEPFFTTKPQGVGTGLGLAISNEIVQEHGGTLLATNAAEGGACFQLRLPFTKR